MLYDPSGERSRTTPATGQLDRLKKGRHRYFVTEQRQLWLGDGHAELYFISAQKPSVLAHDALIVTQGNHKAGPEGVSIHCADGRHRKGHHPCKEGHYFRTEGFAIAA